MAQEGNALYQKYTKDGIAEYVAQQRGAKDSGWMVVGKEQIQVKQGAFSRRDASRMEGTIWREAKDDLTTAYGELLKQAGFSDADIARASFEQRQRLLEELGQKDMLRTSRGTPSRIDLVPVESREKVVQVIDHDLAATCYNSAIDPLATPTIDAYEKMELADRIRAVKLGE